MANQYFLGCFQIQALEFLVERADGTQVALQGTSQAPRQSSSCGCRVCTLQELKQQFRCLSPHLHQAPGPCPAITSTPLLVRGPWAGMTPPFQLQETRTRETKCPEFPRLLTGTSMDFLAIPHVPGGLTQPGGIKGASLPWENQESVNRTGFGSRGHSHGSQLTHELPRHLRHCAAGWPYGN